MDSTAPDLGIVEVEYPDIRKSKGGRKIPKGVQEAVDHWIQLHSQYKKIESMLSDLREVIEPYMDQNDVKVIAGSLGGGIQRIRVDRPPMSARYTAFDPDEVEEFLSEEAKQRCMIKVVDRKALEACCELGLVPEEILELKITMPSYQLRVK